jgi:NTE family protein
MSNLPAAAAEPKITELAAALRRDYGQFVLVLQGGGALGSYQAGVYEALHEAGLEPDWIIGTSIGAINASLISGNSAACRVDRLRQFWSRVEQGSPYDPLFDPLALFPAVQRKAQSLAALTGGIPGFFTPNPLAFLGGTIPLEAEQAAYYSVRPLEATLSRLVDFAYLARAPHRLTIGAASVATSAMRYFDSRDTVLTVKHVLASNALPPLFPAVRIEGALYWDGGILSNTPIEVIFDDDPRRDSLVLVVNLWNAEGPEPETIDAVGRRQIDLIYASRTESQIARQQQIHRMRQIISTLGKAMPEALRQDPALAPLLGYGCTSQMHVIALQAPEPPVYDNNVFTDFSHAGITSRWQAGLADTRRMLQAAPWQQPVDPMLGLHLHRW